MNDRPAIVARYHMPTRGWRETRMYDGRVHIVLPTAPSPELVSWCEAQPNVLATEVGTITPTSLAIYMKDLGAQDHESAKRIWDFLRELSEQLGQTVRSEAVTTFHSQLRRLREAGPPEYTSEMQFLTEPHRRPGDKFREAQPIGMPLTEWPVQTLVVQAGRKPYPIRRWRPSSAPRSWRTWLSQSARWGRWWLLSEAYAIFVIPLLKFEAMVEMIRRIRGHHRRRR